MFNELQHVGSPVGTVQLHVTLRMIYESLVAHHAKYSPCMHEILHHVDVQSGLDVEVACIEEAHPRSIRVSSSSASVLQYSL